MLLLCIIAFIAGMSGYWLFRAKQAETLTTIGIVRSMAISISASMTIALIVYLFARGVTAHYWGAPSEDISLAGGGFVSFYGADKVVAIAEKVIAKKIEK